MFGRKKTKKEKTRQKKQRNSEQLREGLYDIGGASAGLCAGLVIDAGLSMIPCPAVKPAAKAAFKVGKVVLSGIGGKLVSDLARSEIKETVDGASEAMNAIRQARATPAALEETSEQEETDQIYEVEDE